jgi:hypothetical protein
MLYCLPDSILIVDADVGDSRNVGSHVNEYLGNLTKTKVFDERVFHAKGEDRHPIHPALDHATHRRFHALGIVHGGGEQYLVVVFNGLILEGLYDLREKWVGNLRDNQAKQTTPSRNQRTRLCIGIVPKLVHHLPYSLGKLRIDRRNTVNRSGYGGGRNFRSPRDLTDVHGWLETNFLRLASYHAPQAHHIFAANPRKRLPRECDQLAVPSFTRVVFFLSGTA